MMTKQAAAQPLNTMPATGCRKPPTNILTLQKVLDQLA
jgi:hypothetical protein